MDCVLLIRAADQMFEQNDLAFNEKTEKALSFLRSVGVIPIRRASVNSQHHVRFSGMLVAALEQDTTVDLRSHKQSTLHDLGVTTVLIRWLDSAVEQGILVPANGGAIAKGANSMVYVFDNTGDALLVATTPTASLPSGIHTYRGIYAVGDRRYGGADLGEATVAVDFTRGDFAISATSASTSLNGDGFLEVANGNLSGTQFVFVDSVYGTYSASIIGKVGTTAGTDEAVGIWYTNDVNPDFGGGFATKK